MYAQDFTVVGGSFSEVQGQKVAQLMDLALESGVPAIGLDDSVRLANEFAATLAKSARADWVSRRRATS